MTHNPSTDETAEINNLPELLPGKVTEEDDAEATAQLEEELSEIKATEDKRRARLRSRLKKRRNFYPPLIFEENGTEHHLTIDDALDQRGRNKEIRSRLLVREDGEYKVVWWYADLIRQLDALMDKKDNNSELKVIVKRTGTRGKTFLFNVREETDPSF